MFCLLLGDPRPPAPGVRRPRGGGTWPPMSPRRHRQGGHVIRAPLIFRVCVCLFRGLNPRVSDGESKYLFTQEVDNPTRHKDGGRGAAEERGSHLLPLLLRTAPLRSKRGAWGTRVPRVSPCPHVYMPPCPHAPMPLMGHLGCLAPPRKGAASWCSLARTAFCLVCMSSPRGRGRATTRIITQKGAQHNAAALE